MLTNWVTIKKCIDYLQFLTKQEIEGSLIRINKKESIALKKRKARLEKYLIGIKNMSEIPDIVIVVGQHKEINAIKECLKLGVCIITILDTNCDPTITDFLVPANDDSIPSVSLIINSFSDALILNK